MKVGFSRQDITAWEPDMQIWGWFEPTNRISGVKTPLYVRVMFVQQEQQAIAYVCMDLGFVSLAVRHIVLDILQKDYPELGLGPHQVMFTATHTHAGPCGFSDYLAQTSASYGFSPIVLTKIVEGTVTAMLEAYQRLEPATLRVASVQIPLSENIAFNRALSAFRNNVEVQGKSIPSSAHATSRTSLTLRADNPQGQMLGLVNWFPVHATCIHAENTQLHGDNKGIAALLLENTLRERSDVHPNFVAIFAQEASGDVSPNFRYDKSRQKMVGVSQDDEESAQYNAEIHVRFALAGAHLARQNPPLSGDIGGRVRHVNMAHFHVLPQFAGGQLHQSTTPATWGILMPTGTAEGPGPIRPWLPLLRMWMRWRRFRQRLPFLPAKPDIKSPFLQIGLGRDGAFLRWIPTTLGLGLVGRVDPVIGYIHALYQEGILTQEPWLPQCLPVQLLRLGSLAIFGMAGEPTTTAGLRLRKMLSALLAHESVDTLVIQGVANGYAGYVTTPEEYQQQEYEGSYTIFGPHTLGAYQSIATELAALDIAPSPQTPVVGPALVLHSYETLVQHRQIGRKGTWGAGSGSHFPEPVSPFLSRIQQALRDAHSFHT